jgi:membrane associated rhomboid family serine protease
LSDPSARAWWAVSVLLLAAMAIAPLAQGRLDGSWVPWLDWQPGLAGRQPWRWWTPVAVHYSALHWGANAAGLVLVALLGWAARLPIGAALAWCLA